MSFKPSFTVAYAITADLARIERARGFLEATALSEDWIRQMDARALVEKGLSAEAGSAPTDPTRHYRLADGLMRSGRSYGKL